MVGAYALRQGAAHDPLIREAGYDEPIYYHGALTKLCDFYPRIRASNPPPAGSSPQRVAARQQGGVLQARSSVGPPSPSPTAGSGGSPRPRFLFRLGLDAHAGSAPSSAAWNLR